MEYTVQKLGKLAGISTRTLRYYDEIGILKPARINSSGYRIYGQAELDRLQQILFYRELGVSLIDIKNIINEPSFDGINALIEHRLKLLDKRRQIDLLIANVEKTIANKKGGIKMSNKEKFEGFKQKLIDKNEKKYGKEIRAKYGDEEVNKSNAKVKAMSGNPAVELAQKTAELHRKWIEYYWSSYSKEAHAGLAQMYVDDERFTAYYDAKQPGMAAFLRDAIFIYTGIHK